MKKCLLLALAALAVACASAPAPKPHHTHPERGERSADGSRVPDGAIARGPVPAVRPPGTQSMPGVQGVPNTPGQPGYPGQEVPRSKDKRILPGGTSAIYASSGDAPRPRVRGLKPRSAEKEPWEECEKLVLEALESPLGLHAETQKQIQSMSQKNWACVREVSMASCYLFQVAETKDQRGLLKAQAEHEKFLEEMETRREAVCRDLDSDTQEVIDAIHARGALYKWKPATGANLNQQLLPRSPAEKQFDDAVARQRAPKLPSITTNRAAQHAPDVSQEKQGAGIPQKALDKCWAETQTCLNEMGEDVQRLSDPAYYCLRWMGLQRCAFSGANFAQPGSPYEKVMEARWGKGWDEMDLLGFVGARIHKYCPQAAGQGVDMEPRLNALWAECSERYETVFR